MKIADIQKAVNATSEKDVILELKSKRYIAQPDADMAVFALDPKKHKVFDPTIRKDKWVKDDNAMSDGDNIDVNGKERPGMHREPVNRVGLALQQLIVNRAVSFTFGNPVKYAATTENDTQNEIIKAFHKVLSGVKVNSIDRRMARAMFGFKECAEYWYPVGDPDVMKNAYGFASPFKLRCVLWSPAFGDVLYPYFDATGDMVAFSREYTRKDDGIKTSQFFETFTDEEHCIWENGSDGFKILDGYPKANAIGKIPVVYGHQDYFETENVDALIDRLETLLSNFADTNDYHAAPKIFVTGQINGWSKKGESGAVIEGEDGATMQYVSWQSAPESVKLEIETLLKMIYTITQTPDISFDAVKGLNVSGIALKLMFMDAHLKVQDKREIFDEYLQRRANIIKAYLAKMNIGWENDIDILDIIPEITPYMLTSEIDEINMWLAANGNKPLVSHKESVKGASLTSDPDADFDQIKSELDSENYFETGEPVDA